MKQRRQSSVDSSWEEATVNLTPLIDVVFVVLIIFILIAPMLELDKVQLAHSAATNGKRNSALEKSSLHLHVHADNTIWVNGKKIEEQQLFSLLKQMHKKAPAHIPQLFHDQKAYFGTYQMVKNAVELAGYTEMDVILKPG